MDVKGYFKDFFKTRWVGWYIHWASLALMLVVAIVYGVVYSDMSMQRYFSSAAFAVIFVAFAAGVVLAFVRPATKWAPLVVFGLLLCSFCLFVNGTYMIVSTAFFAGVNAAAFAALDKGFVMTVVFYLIPMIVCIVALFVKHERTPKKAEQQPAAQEQPITVEE